MSKRPLEILLVEDSPADVGLTRVALEVAATTTRLSDVGDGVEAMDFLKRRGRHANAPRPDLILLDLNMPRMDGRELLAMIKADEELRDIPVVILTTSSADTDIKACYKSHCNCYITKPVELDDFLRILQSVDSYWNNVVTLPEPVES